MLSIAMLVNCAILFENYVMYGWSALIGSLVLEAIIVLAMFDWRKVTDRFLY